MNLLITNVRKNCWLLGLLLLAGWLFVPEAKAQSTTLVEWTFPNNPDDAIADGGIAANLNRSIGVASSTTCGSTLGTPTFSGNANRNWINVTGWDSGANCKFWGVDFTTLGYSNITLSSALLSTVNAPKDWKVQYRVGTGGTWTDIPGASFSASNDWVTGALSNIALPAAAENQTQVFVRWIMTSNLRVDQTTPGALVASGAAARMEDIIVKGMPLATITVSSPGPSAGNVIQGTTDHVIYRLNLGVTGSSTTLNALTLTTGGPNTGTGYVPSDIQNFKLRYSADAILTASDPTLATLPTVALGSNLSFTGLSQVINAGNGYLFITADVDPAATLGSAISINAMPLSNIIFSNGTKTGSNPIPAGGAQTFIRRASASSVIRAVGGTETAVISSLVNGAVNNNSDGVQVWGVTLFDGDGINDDSDVLPTRYSSLTISAGAGNTVANWGNTIESAQFFDGNSATPIAGSVAIVNNIIAFTPNTPIVVADGAGSSKTLSLRITLKTNLPINSDGKAFRFQLVEGLVGVDAETTSSQLGTFSASSASNTNVIDVVATELSFLNVPGSVFINSNFQLTVSATDAHGNVDMGFMTDISLNLGLGNGNLSALSGLNAKSLVNGTYTWSDLQYDIAEDFAADVTDHSGLLPYAISPVIKATTLNFTSFDNFNRGDNSLLGLPSSGGSLAWSEIESAGSNNHRVRVAGNALVLSSFNNTNTGIVGIEQANFNMTGRYATVFEQAAGDLVWVFNMRQSQINPTGFSNGNGAAYVVGSSEANFASPTAYGYAVVMGNPGTQKAIRLVRFTGGITNNSNLTTIASVDGNATDYYSVKVMFDPCTKEWSLLVRNDGTTSFADPATIGTTPVSGTDRTYTDASLAFMGALWYHQIGNVTALFDNIYVPNAVASSPETYVWNGSSSTDFNNEYNWSPLRGCIRDTDMLVFNGGTATTVSNVPSQIISKLTVTNNTTLTLRPLGGGTQTISIVNGAGEDLIVNAGSSLIMDGNTALEISLGAGAIARINGTIQVQNTIGNLGRDHRLMAADANAIVFENGSRFVARNLSGEAFGNTGTANTVTFKANSAYVSRSGGNPFGLTSPASKVVFETGSLYSHEQISILPGFDGRRYADFELNVPAAVNILTGNNAGELTSFDNFTIANGSLNFSLLNAAAPQPVAIRGNVSVAPGSVLNFSPATATVMSPVNFVGTTAQQINGTVLFGAFANVEINNAAGVVTNTDLTINGNLSLAQGALNFSNKALTLRGQVQGNGMLVANALSDLTLEGDGSMGNLNFQTGGQVLRNLNLDRRNSGSVTFNNNLTVMGTVAFTNGVLNMGSADLIFADNAQALSASDNSYVTGSVIKTGNDAFEFPLGGNGFFAPIAISAPQSVTDQFMARYNQSSPITAFGNTLESSLNNISSVEFWNLERTAGSSEVMVNINYHNTRSAGVGLPADLRVARFNPGTGWSDEGTADLVTGDNSGSLRTAATQDSYGVFTLGSVSPVNPLPVELVNFKAVAKTKVVDLTWETATERNNSRFEVQRSTDARNFETIGTVKGHGNSNTLKRYALTDEKPVTGTSYYRLKQIDLDGTAAYSKIAAVQFARTEQVVRLYPNPTRDRMTVALGQQMQGELQIMNAVGQLVKTVKVNTTGSNSDMELNLTELPAGTYTLRVVSDRSSQTYKFVKMN